MKSAERICKEALDLPEPLAREVLDFIGYLKHKHVAGRAHVQSLKDALMPVMQHIWDNAEDEVCNDL